MVLQLPRCRPSTPGLRISGDPFDKETKHLLSCEFMTALTFQPLNKQYLPTLSSTLDKESGGPDLLKEKGRYYCTLVVGYCA